MKKHKRRSFIKKATTVFTGGALFNLNGFALNNLIMTSKSVYNIEPIGFQWKTYDPFLFCAYHNDKFPRGNGTLGPDQNLLQGRNIGQDFSGKDGWSMYHGKTVPGFPVHPHRGFETITMVRKGLVDHTDSMHAAGRYGNGDVQWMTAGKGVQHAEMFPLVHNEKDNPLELFQIWLNLPRKSKLTEPFFKMFWSQDVPKINHQNNGNVNIEIIAGQLEGHAPIDPAPQSWASDPENNVAVWNIKMEKGSKWEIPATASDVNRTIYLYQGDSAIVDSTTIAGSHMAKLKPDENITIEANTSDCALLLLQGKPIGEPVVQYGPFVMNTKQEIMDTYQEYQQTQFGGWPWDNAGPTHGNKKRFATYADGTSETPE